MFESVIENINPDIDYFGTARESVFLQEISEKDYDLYIVDFTLERTQGDEIFKEILKVKDHPVVIIISSGIICDIMEKFEAMRCKPKAIVDRIKAIEIIKRIIND